MDERPALQLPATGPARSPRADEITFIGTATTLIKVAGFAILADPNFLHRGDRAYLVQRMLPAALGPVVAHDSSARRYSVV